MARPRTAERNSSFGITGFSLSWKGHFSGTRAGCGGRRSKLLAAAVSGR